MRKQQKVQKVPLQDGSTDPRAAVLARYRNSETVDFAHAWIALEPTFTNKHIARKWQRVGGTPRGEERYFRDPVLVRTMRRVANGMSEAYERCLGNGSGPHCWFQRVRQTTGRDEWWVERQELDFQWKDRSIESFNVRVGIDPEVIEYSVKPIPAPWFYEEDFVRFLQEFLWDVPLGQGLFPSLNEGGGQFHLSAKTLLRGSLLADEIAFRVSHPELACWTTSLPGCDERAFRATRERHLAFNTAIEQYWNGCFHPRAIGTLRVQNALLDRGFDPAPSPRPELADPRAGPVGSPREVFQTNFAFARRVRLRAQNVHPGYWQYAHPEEDGYRPDQIMRYSEGNLNRLQIRGELDVKSGKPIEEGDASEFDAPLEAHMLARDASWEYRAQSSRTSARDAVEAVLLELHHLQYLEQHPHVPLRYSLLQDQLLGDAEVTLKKHARPERLAQLHARARKANLTASRGRMKTDWIEPEVLFWAAWKALPRGEKVAIAREAVGGFLEKVEQAASLDPRPKRDPMEWHRHRVHPLLWKVLQRARASLGAEDPVRRELLAFEANSERYLARRPVWSATVTRAPWL
jgi:hypothetical protein